MNFYIKKTKKKTKKKKNFQTTCAMTGEILPSRQPQETLKL